MTHFEAVLADLDTEIAHLARRPPSCEWTSERLATLMQIRGWLIEALIDSGDGEVVVAMTRSAVIGSLLQRD